MSFSSVRQTLDQAFTGSKSANDLQRARVMYGWEVVLKKIWGEERARRVKIVSFDQGILRVRTNSPVVRQALQQMLPKLISEVNQFLKQKFIRTVSIDTSYDPT